jgi:anti-sigma-K factor RskA
MRYQNPKLSEQLAAEYVLGTLRGRARQRFERLLRQYPHLRREVENWELSLNKLSAQAPPVEPPAQVWQNLEQKLFARQPESLRWYQRLFLWRSLSVGSSLLAIVLAILLWFEPLSQQQDHYIVLLDDQTQQVAWSMTTSNDMQQFMVRNLRPMTIPKDQGCLLWVKSIGSNEMYALGRLPDDGSSVVLPIAEQLRDILLNAELVVTVENIEQPIPPVPTGPAEYTGQLVAMPSI